MEQSQRRGPVVKIHYAWGILKKNKAHVLFTVLPCVQPSDPEGCDYTL